MHCLALPSKIGQTWSSQDPSPSLPKPHMFLTLVRCGLGAVNSHFLPQACDSDASSDFLLLRVICCSDMLDDCFKWYYKRVFFMRMSGWLLVFGRFQDMSIALCIFGLMCFPKAV